MARFIHVDQRKWPDREHYQLEVRLLGRDEHGTWVHAKAGTVVRRGHDEPWALPGGGFVGLIPGEEWWIVSFYPNHPEIEIYVDIGTPPEWDGSRLTFIDLDLDVIRRLDGTVEILDEEEFEEHRVALGYPDNLVAAARGAADRVALLMRDEVEPFGAAAGEWLAVAKAMSRGDSISRGSTNESRRGESNP